MFSFARRSIYRFAYSTVVGHIISSIIEVLTVNEEEIIKILTKKLIF